MLVFISKKGKDASGCFSAWLSSGEKKPNKKTTKKPPPRTEEMYSCCNNTNTLSLTRSPSSIPKNKPRGSNGDTD